jgi:hypothetical protein
LDSSMMILLSISKIFMFWGFDEFLEVIGFD